MIAVIHSWIVACAWTVSRKFSWSFSDTNLIRLLCFQLPVLSAVLKGGPKKMYSFKQNLYLSLVALKLHTQKCVYHPNKPLIMAGRHQHFEAFLLPSQDMKKDNFGKHLLGCSDRFKGWPNKNVQLQNLLSSYLGSVARKLQNVGLYRP